MKDSEFIELLNLYLDHEISADDAARLETEIRSNLERRRVYLQYCKMQQACRVIAADFATAESESASAADKKVVPFALDSAGSAARRRRLQFSYAAGAFAAAACVALIFASRRAPSITPGVEQPAATMAASVPTAAGGLAVATSHSPGPRGLVSIARPGPSPTLVANPLLLTGSSQAEAVRAAAVRQADNQLAWLEALQLAPLPERTTLSQDLHFGARLITEGRALGNRASSHSAQPEPGEEMVTFQIVK
ncbi:MAG: zf-HC2 domain-containing protein [Opitutaceae bacterium]|nr:zf-HC2 domain-containing protein [Opitutaceae bacterium]